MEPSIISSFVWVHAVLHVEDLSFFGEPRAEDSDICAFLQAWEASSAHAALSSQAPALSVSKMYIYRAGSRWAGGKPPRNQNIGIYGPIIVAHLSRHDITEMQMKKCNNSIKDFTVDVEKPNSPPQYVFLGVSWITNNYRGRGQTNVSDLVIWPYTPNQTRVRWNRLEQKEKCPFWKHVWILVDWRPRCGAFGRSLCFWSD